MQHEEYGTVEDYVRAFTRVVAEGLAENHAALLQAHASAPRHTASWTQLAREVGYKSGSSVNLQYGLLAKRVGRELGLIDAPRDAWVFVFADWARGRDPEGHTRFVMRRPALDAAIRLGIVGAAT